MSSNKRKKPGYPRPTVMQAWPKQIVETHTTNTFAEKFESFHPQNRKLDEDIKLAALKVSPTVVGIGCVTLDLVFHFFASGTIVKSEQTHHSTYLSTIITSASIFGSYSHKNFKADVYTASGRIFKARDFEFDKHYNVALIRFESDLPMPTATLRLVDDSYPHSSERSFQLRAHSEAFRLSPTDRVVAVGRYFDDPFDLMAAPGHFSLKKCGFDCQQLRRTTCNITKCGIGGPLINLHGEVIGINFYHEDYTPFLPVNIALKCLESLEKSGKSVRPCFGIKAANICAATSLAKLEKIIQKIPDPFRGVLVKKVVPESCADHAGIRKGDHIVHCDGKILKSPLEFDTMLLDKVGKSVEVYVARTEEPNLLKIIVTVDETSPDKFYSWPIPKERVVRDSPTWSRGW